MLLYSHVYLVHVASFHVTFVVAGFHIESVSITANQSVPILLAGTMQKIIFVCAVEVLCSGPCADTNVTFRWIKDGSEVFTESSQQVTLAEDSTIHEEMAVINRKIAVTDAGSYHCQAELSEMPAVNNSAAQNISIISECSGIKYRISGNFWSTKKFGYCGRLRRLIRTFITCCTPCIN